MTVPPKPSRTHPRARWRLPKVPFFIAVLCLVGVLILMYPSIAAWYSSVAQSAQLKGYTHDVQQVGPVGRLHALQEAHEYNDALTGGALVAANKRIPEAEGTKLPAQFDYNKLLDADPYGLMGRIKIPSIDVDLPIYHGTSDAILAKGVGHLEGTSLPVGGLGTHAVLTGHRGLATSTLFTNLNKVKVGDTFTIIVFGDVLTYRVIDTKVVDPDQTKSLDPVPGKDLVTLVTCTPIGINSQRILVTGERVSPTPQNDLAAAASVPNVPGFAWWAVLLGLAVLVLGAYVWASGRPRPPRRSHRARPRRS